MTKLIIVSVAFLVALILITMHFLTHVQRDFNTGEFRMRDGMTFMRMVIGDVCLAGFIAGLIVSNVVIG
jgi:hypothetical protein|nr:MAG TPA: hypothetical protein [Caudoviricetes sp.]